MKAVEWNATRLKADLALLMVTVFWGSAFAANRVAAAYVGPLLFNGLRFCLGGLLLVPLVLRGRRPLSRLEWWGGALAGGLLYAGSALQQAGLSYTTAGNAGFITGLYVVFVPLLLALVWRQAVRWLVWAAVLLAAAGLYFLSGIDRLAISFGDGLELAGAVMWAFHVIVIGRLAARVDVFRLAVVQYGVCGLFSLLSGLVLEGHTLPGLAFAWWAVVYTAVFSIALGYTVQIAAQRHAPAADAAVIMSMEGVFAALAGWLFLRESLTPFQLLGCGLMLAGMLLAQADALVRGAPEPAAYPAQPTQAGPN